MKLSINIYWKTRKFKLEQNQMTSWHTGLLQLTEGKKFCPRKRISLSLSMLRSFRESGLPPSREHFDEPRARSFSPLPFLLWLSEHMTFCRGSTKLRVPRSEGENKENDPGLVWDYPHFRCCHAHPRVFSLQALWISPVRWLIRRVIWILRWKTRLMNQLFVLSSTRG